ncbi:unnamed protein product [Rotaria sp. Silwood2]|nr:unnamed protein product [Rotaria sp. Silwood2]
MYVYDKDEDLISVYFIKNNSILSSLFRMINFQSKISSDISQSCWTVVGEYQYNQDNYSILYLFVFNDIDLLHFEIGHQVKGLFKDYVSKKKIFHREKQENCLQIYCIKLEFFK